MKKLIKNAMNEWGFIGQESLLALGMSATSINLWLCARREVRASNPHSS